MANQHFDEYIRSLLSEIKGSNRIHTDDIPGIDLYMDQVTTFMDDHLGHFKREESEKILTKTMINNYSKFGLLPPTNKKKYTNDHLILMLFIYYLKPILSINDIKELLNPVTAMLNDKKQPKNIRNLIELHERIINEETSHFDIFETHIVDTLDVAKSMFDDVDDEKQRDLLSIFATSYLLTVQAAAQKHMVTSMIDEFLNKYEKPAEKSTGRKKKK